jgi:hypothetical protein
VQKQSLSHLYWFVGACALVDLVSGVIYSLFPWLRSQIVTDDRLVQNATAAMFLCAFVLGVVMLRDGTMAGRGRGERRIVLLVSGLGLLCFFEELSYGERIFKLKMPHVSGVKIDCIHDFFYLAYLKLGPWFTTRHTLVAALAVTGAGLAFNKSIKRWVSAVVRSGPLLLLVAFVLIDAAAQVLDLRVIRSYHAKFFEETFELNSAMALIACLLSAATRRRVEPVDAIAHSD